MPATTREIQYRDDEKLLTGVLVDDGDDTGQRPGILLVHGGAGLDGHARGQAERYAALGYTVFACDMFGEGVMGNRERVMETLNGLRSDPDVLAQRAASGLSVLREQDSVDRSRCGAVGFCFGGLTVITLARSGAELRGVVSMHGSFKTSRPAEPGRIAASVLACHGALDPHVPLTDMVALVEEMDRAGADLQVIVYSGAMHGFTHAQQPPGQTPGVEYHELTDRRSFAAATAFFSEVFAG